MPLEVKSPDKVFPQAWTMLDRDLRHVLGQSHGLQELLRFSCGTDGRATDSGPHDPGKRCINEIAVIVRAGQQKVGRTDDLFKRFLPELNVFVPQVDAKAVRTCGETQLSAGIGMRLKCLDSWICETAHPH